MLYGHIIMAILLILVAIFVVKNIASGSFLCMCFFVLTFQLTNGSVFFVYIAEISTDAAMGASITILMATLLT